MTKRDSTPFPTEYSYYTPISIPKQNTETIEAIQRTLQDLQSQKEVIDITIGLLQHRLNLRNRKPLKLSPFYLGVLLNSSCQLSNKAMQRNFYISCSNSPKRNPNLDITPAKNWENGSSQKPNEVKDQKK